MLENEIPDTTGDDLEQLLDELLSVLKFDVGLAAQLFPELFRACDLVGIGLSGLALQLESLLLCVGLARRIA